MGRTVKKGQKGIGIIAPMVGKKKDEDGQSSEAGEKMLFGFKVVHVFDVSQTEGDDLPEFASVAGDPGENIAAVESLIRSWGIELALRRDSLWCGRRIEEGHDRRCSRLGTGQAAADVGP